jgi:hypothetical protein
MYIINNISQTELQNTHLAATVFYGISYAYAQV